MYKGIKGAVGGEVIHKNLVLSNELTKGYHSKHQLLESHCGGQFSLSTHLIEPDFHVQGNYVCLSTPFYSLEYYILLNCVYIG